MELCFHNKKCCAETCKFIEKLFYIILFIRSKDEKLYKDSLQIAF
jgi:hypothetical protein